MAQSILTLKQFLGLNENPDGDTKIRDGELSRMRNFRITLDRHLQVRPGTQTKCTLKAAWDTWCETHTPATAAPVFSGAWYGTVGSGDCLVAAYGGVLFHIHTDTWSAVPVGTCTQAPTSFFAFSNRLYLLNGHEYLRWGGDDDTPFETVTGYIPTVQTAVTPGGSGTLLENVNRLNGWRKVKFSPDGTSTVFHLPEQAVDEVASVEGTDLTYTTDLPAGTLTFQSAPTEGTNTVTVTYRKGDGARSEVEGMRFSELFNGSTESRVFLYGDGSNKTICSGLDSNGNPTAEYFPDLYEVAVGEENTPITALVRHYARLLVYKTQSVWSVQYGTLTLDDGRTTAAFYATTVNRSLGNEAPGQVRLVENNPLSLCAGSIYQWKPNSSSGNLTSDERTARRISDRVWATVRTFDFSSTVTFNDRDNYEFWFVCGDTAVILNYANDTWYLYRDLPIAAMLRLEGGTYLFSADGVIRHLDRTYRGDDGEPIDAYAATGSMDFDRDWLRKYTAWVWIALQPEDNARIDVTVESNRRSDYGQKTVATSLATFSHVNFAHFSFRTNRKPQVQRIKLKVKKAAFYKLIFSSCSASSTATVLEADVQFRTAGVVKS